ncbi:cation:proton antiporter [Mycolicibacterium moriokaense]|uniref:Sodium/proton antiporter (CPA1 family) n=1 Tax=Mycolicibacterium moriokaense TaxID=39691 RepID=A0A318HKM4_9MYCO|nr:cation:proton antiporter [Mycolicibacterium moriokaense]PXX08793.1 sodium/proton antiporter (CPA1 family) [Mycolicibacterium moriokaense]
MGTDTAFVMTILVLSYAVVSGLVNRWYIAPALIFVGFGMALGPFGFGVIDAGAHTQSFTILAQLALTVILFNQAAMLDVRSVVRRGHLPLRLLAIGIPLSIILGTAVALLVMPVMPLWEAVCLATIVAPTEVALIDALLEDRRIPERIRHAMSAESGCYDGFALAAMLAALALASEQADPDPGRWTWFAVRVEGVSLVVGLGIGLIGGLVLVMSHEHGWMSDTWAQLATVALALVCFAVGERLHGSGFVTAFAGGLAYSMMVRRAGAQMPSQVTDAAGQLLELTVFAMFGSYAVFVGWRDADWRVVVFAVVALLVVRLAAVSAALIGSDLPARGRLFIGWFGPRGIGTLVLGLLMIERGEIQQSAIITQAVVVTVTISLVVHSLTTPLGVRLWPIPPAHQPQTVPN